MTKEQKKAVKSMEKFVNSSNMSGVSVAEMKEVLVLIDTLTQRNETLGNIINKQDKMIDSMAEVICILDVMDNYDTWNNDISEVRKHFERKIK